MTTAAEMRDALRSAISNAYYENRGKGQTMETAADDAVAAVLPIVSALIAQVAAETRAGLVEALANGERGLAERAYWYFLMTQQGGPDGSELDAAVTEDMLDALRRWAEAHPDTDALSALPAPEPSSGAAPVEERCKDEGCIWAPSGTHVHAPDGSVYGEVVLPPAPRSAGAGDGRTDR